MNKKLIQILIVLLIATISCLSADVYIYFSPDGGFSPKNNKRIIQLKDGKKVMATPGNAFLDLIQRTENGGQIKIAMYAFSSKNMMDALIDAAKNRQITVKLILDSVASWTGELHGNLAKRILNEHKLAKKEKRAFDFQLKRIYPQAMIDRKRTRVLQDGKMIYGTMHEKFGVFYNKNSVVPLHAFCGSANVSYGASHIFAENRIIFKYEPKVGQQLAEEFARLWNEYGTAVTEGCKSEKFVPASTNNYDVQIISNSVPLDEESYQRIDERLIKLMEKVDPEKGTLDVAMFSFTHFRLASTIIFLARRYPKIKVRVLMDQTQMANDENRKGVLGPYLEKEIKKRRLKNAEVRYKWRSNALGWDEESKTCMLIHWRNLLLHHKAVVVNKKFMGVGSYNWSGSAEERNFENVMFFNGNIPKHQAVVNRFGAEFDVMWEKLRTGKTSLKEKLAHPQVVKGPYGRSLNKKIIAAYSDAGCREIMKLVDANRNGVDQKTLGKKTKIYGKKLQEKLDTLVKATLIFARNKKGKTIYQLVD